MRTRALATFIALYFCSSSSLLFLCDLIVQAFVIARYPGTVSQYRVLFFTTSRYRVFFFFFLFLLLFVCMFVSSSFILLCNCTLPRWSLQGGSCLQGAEGGDFQSVGARNVLTRCFVLPRCLFYNFGYIWFMSMVM